MARRKNTKRIDPRYFLNETVNRGEELEECGEMDGEAIDISAPGMEVHVDDISQLSPEEAFAAGMAAARDAIDQAMGTPDGPPPEGGLSGGGPAAEPALQETAPATRYQAVENPSQLGITVDGLIDSFYGGDIDGDQIYKQLRVYLAAGVERGWADDIGSLIDVLIEKKFSEDLDGFLYDPAFRERLITGREP